MPPSFARLAAAALGLFGALLLSEALARRHFEYDPQAMLAALDRIESSVLSEVPKSDPSAPGTGPSDEAIEDRVTDPYLGWSSSVASRYKARLLERFGPATSALDGAQRAAAPASRTKVMVLGGSVAAGFAGGAGLHLGKAPPMDRYDCVFVNGAAGGYKQPQQVIQLAHALAIGFEPDLVINLDGFNEVALANRNSLRGFHPAQPSIDHWLSVARSAGGVAELRAAGELANARERLLSSIELARDGWRLRFALSGAPLFGQIEGLQADYRRASAALAELMGSGTAVDVLRGPRFEVEDRIPLAIRAWEESSRTLAGICASHQIAYVHVLQPTLHDPGAKPISDEERASGQIAPEWLEGVVKGYPLLRARGAALAADGISFLDASRVFAEVTEPLYFDNCHFGFEGNKLLADAVAEFIAGELADGRLSF
jgi:hypothetical protein